MSSYIEHQISPKVLFLAVKHSLRLNNNFVQSDSMLFTWFFFVNFASMEQTYKDYKDVQQCLLQIEENLGWGSSSLWHSNVFVELSEAIKQKTGVLLSPTTLKRVWGKINYDSAPSISTLNALAEFIDYLNWRDFKTKNNVKKASGIPKVISSHLWIIVTSAAVMTIVFISFYSMQGKDIPIENDFSNLEFSSKSIAEGLPNSVVFDFNFEGIESDNIYIQQYWDKTKTIKLRPNQVQATGQYYFPGYFRAKFVVDGEIKKEHDLFIKSDGWLGTIDYEPIPKYYTKESVFQKNLSLPNAALQEIASSEKPLVSSFHYVTDLGNISGDNIEVETSIKSLYTDKWGVCQNTTILVLGTKSAIMIPFAIPGCISELGVMLSETYLSGKEHDLSAFGTDLSVFQPIKIHIENKTVSVYIEDDLIYKRQYQSSIGNVVGIRYRFLGAGEVDYLHLKDLNTEKNILNQDF